MEKLPNILINYFYVERYQKFNDISFWVLIKPLFDFRSFRYSHLFQHSNIIQFKATPNIVLKCNCVKCINFLYPRLKGHSQGHFNKLCKNHPKSVQYAIHVLLTKSSFAVYFNLILIHLQIIY